MKNNEIGSDTVEAAKREYRPPMMEEYGRLSDVTGGYIPPLGDNEGFPGSGHEE